MEELNSFLQSSAEVHFSLGGIIGTCAAMLFVAIFYTVILGVIYGVKLKPGWIMFAILPSIFLFTVLIVPNLAMAVVAVIFVFTFVLGLFGALIFSPIKSLILGAKEAYQVAPKGKKLISMGNAGLHASMVFLLLASFFVFGPLVPILFLVGFLVYKQLSKGSQFSFYRLTESLPTSKARSAAIGLTELKGKIIRREEVTAPIDNNLCIGYLYKVEKVNENSKGSSSYTTISIDQVVKTFDLEDDTGKIAIDGDKLQFITIPVYKRYTSKGFRYTQYVLTHGMEVFVIGDVTSDNNGKSIVKYSDSQQMFGICPAANISRYEKLKPILEIIIYYGVIWAIIIAIILATPVSLSDDGLEIGKPKLFRTEFFNYFKRGKGKEPEVIKVFEDNNIYKSEDLDTMKINVPQKSEIQYNE